MLGSDKCMDVRVVFGLVLNRFPGAADLLTSLI